MLTDLQKRTAQAIVNIFETGQMRGDYGKVTLIPGDPGHLTYGRSQTTLASGNLHLLLKDYCETADSAFGGRLRRYLARLAARDTGSWASSKRPSSTWTKPWKPTRRNSRCALWSSVVKPECDLVRALARKTLAQETQAIVDGYRRAKTRGGSPRELRSVLEHLEFLADIAAGARPGDTQAEAEALRTISGQLSALAG